MWKDGRGMAVHVYSSMVQESASAPNIRWAVDPCHCQLFGCESESPLRFTFNHSRSR